MTQTKNDRLRGAKSWLDSVSDPLPENALPFFSIVFAKKTEKCIFFSIFFRFALLFFKIWGIVTHRVFAIRQERSHITFGICCENEVAPLKKGQPETTAALRINWVI